MAENNGSSRSRPTISLPPRASIETIFSGGASPGPMTLVSSFFSESDPDSEYRSFSQLLAGAMGSPVGVMGRRVMEKVEEEQDKELGGGGDHDFRFLHKQNKASLFTIPPGLSPTSLFDSPGLFSPGQDKLELECKLELERKLELECKMELERKLVDKQYAEDKLVEAKAQGNRQDLKDQGHNHQQEKNNQPWDHNTLLSWRATNRHLVRGLSHRVGEAIFG